jgi:ActR/RegA family two-component response regulator
MIIIYEDEKYYIKESIEALKASGFEVEVFSKATELLKCVESTYEQIDIFIIDLMVFGPGNKFPNDDTDGGLGSGLALVNEIERIENRLGVTSRKKKIILTNRQGQILEELRKDPRVFAVLRKPDVLPPELVEIVLNATNKGRK